VEKDQAPAVFVHRHELELRILLRPILPRFATLRTIARKFGIFSWRDSCVPAFHQTKFEDEPFGQELVGESAALHRDHSNKPMK